MRPPDIAKTTHYPPESAGSYMERVVPTALPEDTVAQVVQMIAKATRKWDSLTYVYVLDHDKRPVGVVTIEELYASSPSDTMSNIMRVNIEAVDPYMDQEQAAITAIRSDLDAAPVVDSKGRFIGAIDHDNILDILRYENIEDLLRLSGIHAERPIVDIVRARITQLVRMRIPWLVLGLVGGMLATVVIGSFVHTLERELALAFFIPVIVYMSDAVATQTETIFIRSLSLEAIDVKRYLAREALVGVILGVVLSALLFMFAVLYLQQLSVAVVVGLAMLASISTAVFIAILIPWILSKFKRDPAFGSGPFATIVQDILSIIIYFAIATLILFR
ncbi:MAG: magnesium transporter [Actinobacteria bacterium]|nr:magnesium transporter [Actinomycetota bacterium]